MASTIDTPATFIEHKDPAEDAAAAVVTSGELLEAKRDPRVRSFLLEADAYLVELERQGRNR